MRFYQYLTEAEKQYHLRLKTIVPLDDPAMDRIEMAVAKYLPLLIARPKKTILQRQPLEFPDVQNAEVYMVDMSFALPAAPHVLRDDIRKALNVADREVFVRNQAEPGELEMEMLNAVADIEAEATAKGYARAAMLNDPDYNEAESRDHAELFGNAHNAAFLSYLSAVQKEREDRTVHVANAPFTWLDLPDRTTDNPDFNADIVGAPRVAPQGVAVPPSERHSLGHFEAGKDSSARRMYLDDKGDRVVLARKLFPGDEA